MLIEEDMERLKTLNHSLQEELEKAQAEALEYRKLEDMAREIMAMPSVEQSTAHIELTKAKIKKIEEDSMALKTRIDKARADIQAFVQQGQLILDTINPHQQ